MTEISVTNEISCDPLFSERLLAIDQLNVVDLAYNNYCTTFDSTQLEINF
ncbi:hypothetical protein T08_14600 [Trichinella sp. T8]|nr:hypothetical protein T08_14600 [Trichinella sp. T8]